MIGALSTNVANDKCLAKPCRDDSKMIGALSMNIANDKCLPKPRRESREHSRRLGYRR